MVALLVDRPVIRQGPGESATVWLGYSGAMPSELPPAELPAPWPDAWALCRAIYPQAGWTALRRRWRLAWCFWRHRSIHRRLRQGPAEMAQDWGALAAAQPRLFRKPYLGYPCAGWEVEQRLAHLLTHHRLEIGRAHV